MTLPKFFTLGWGGSATPCMMTQKQALPLQAGVAC